MNILQLVIKAMMAGALLCSGSASADVINLPAQNNMSVGVYNDFNIYSLDLLNKCAADPRCQPQSGIPVQSSPGQITDQAVVLQSANGQTNFPNPFPLGSSVDDRFLTPTGNQSSTYQMGSFGAETGGKFAGDQTNRWDISLSLLQNYLDGHDLVFLFDNNQEGVAPDAFLFIWAQARIVDSSGATVNNLCFEVSSGAAGCGDSGANPAPASGDYLAAVSDFCVDKITGAAYDIGLAHNAGDCPVSALHTAGGYQVENNLSTGYAEFAAFNQALHNAATDAANGQYFLELNVKYYGNNSGAEQLWICSDCTIDKQRQVPEPASLPLVLLGLTFAGLTLARARRRK